VCEVDRRHAVLFVNLAHTAHRTTRVSQRGDLCDGALLEAGLPLQIEVCKVDRRPAVLFVNLAHTAFREHSGNIQGTFRES
jgi:hypothetical protein